MKGSEGIGIYEGGNLGRAVNQLHNKLRRYHCVVCTEAAKMNVAYDSATKLTSCIVGKCHATIKDGNLKIIGNTGTFRGEK